jgi:hypothetical protein
VSPVYVGKSRFQAKGTEGSFLRAWFDAWEASNRPWFRFMSGALAVAGGFISFFYVTDSANSSRMRAIVSAVGAVVGVVLLFVVWLCLGWLTAVYRQRNEARRERDQLALQLRGGVSLSFEEAMALAQRSIDAGKQLLADTATGMTPQQRYDFARQVQEWENGAWIAIRSSADEGVWRELFGPGSATGIPTTDPIQRRDWLQSKVAALETCIIQSSNAAISPSDQT